MLAVTSTSPAPLGGFMRPNRSSTSISLSLFLTVSCLLALGGCSEYMSTSQRNGPTTAPSEHPMVRIIGSDGTVLDGELLNGSVTVECGQGMLTLLTDHINSIQINPDADVVESRSVKLAGKIKDQQFLLRNEHGVFTLMKERLHKIDFGVPPGSVPAPTTPVPATYSKPTMARDGQ
jgi:hypothetical protein